MAKVRFNHRARADLAAITAYYDEQEYGLGERFLTSVLETADRISEWPTSFPEVIGRFRRARAGKFPVGLFFEKRDDAFEIVAVIDLRRDPRWMLDMLGDR